MISDTDTAERFVPDRPSPERLREAAAHCTACSLYRHATQPVLGRGDAHAALMLVGEQPGDQEDRAGRPFVGPAGELLARVLADAGLDPERVYLTNAVKHFKWQPRGRRRLHQRPNSAEIRACRPWLAAEIRWTEPRCIVALGATAAESLFGKKVTLSRLRGTVHASPWAPGLVVTYHPSAALRHPRPEERERLQRDLRDDLIFARDALARL